MGDARTFQLREKNWGFGRNGDTATQLTFGKMTASQDNIHESVFGGRLARETPSWFSNSAKVLEIVL